MYICICVCMYIYIYIHCIYIYIYISLSRSICRCNYNIYIWNNYGNIADYCCESYMNYPFSVTDQNHVDHSFSALKLGSDNATTSHQKVHTINAQEGHDLLGSKREQQTVAELGYSCSCHMFFFFMNFPMRPGIFFVLKATPTLFHGKKDYR